MCAIPKVALSGAKFYKMPEKFTGQDLHSLVYQSLGLAPYLLLLAEYLLILRWVKLENSTVGCLGSTWATSTLQKASQALRMR